MYTLCKMWFNNFKTFIVLIILVCETKGSILALDKTKTVSTIYARNFTSKTISSGRALRNKV